jgi:rhodanese-related sulfurtransferase
MSTLDAISTPTGQGFREVTPRAIAAHLATLRILDVREVAEFNDALGHIAGAELVPLATVPLKLSELSRSAPTLVVCRSGGRSGRGASLLAAAGFSNVYNLSGGMLAWNAEGLPTTRA